MLDQDFTRAEAARSLDINTKILGRRINEHQTDGDQAFRGNGKLTLEQDDVVQDICIQLHNTRYRLARWVRPMG